MDVKPACLKLVAEFHRLFKCPILEAPAIPDPTRCALRVSLLREEVQELADAVAANDLVEIADALADIQYVLSGAVLEFGMASCFGSLFDEVHRSNMSKACNDVEEAETTCTHYREKKATECFYEQAGERQYLVYRAGDRKALKSVKYSECDLKPILDVASTSRS